MRLPGVIDIGNIKHTWKGEWDQGTVYFLNDVVKYHGQKFVCIDTELSDNRKYGEIYKPTVANEYWQPFSYGYLWRGGWNYRDEYYPGDVIKWNGDWYVCNTYNFGGHPVYENGGLTSKWTKIMSTGNENTNKRHHHLWLGNFEPMGWTRNMCSNGVELGYSALELTLQTINGNFEQSFVGRCDGTYTGAGYLGGNFVSQQQSGNCDWWDYYDGYNSSITGGLPKCVQILTGYYQTMALYDNGEVYAQGNNNYGYLGDGSSTSRVYPAKFGRLRVTTQITPVGNGRRTGVLRDVFIIKMASNMYNAEYLYNHTLLLDNQGRVWACGYNGYGQIGQGTDEAAAFYEPVLIPQKFFDNTKIVDIWVISTGSASNSFALDENGQLWAWGYNQYGSLGIGDYNSSNASCVRPVKQPIDWTRYGGIKKFQATGNSTNNCHGGVVLTNDGSLWAWGGTWATAAVAFGEGTNRDYIYKPEKYKTLLYNRANTAGLSKTQLNQMGVTMDVVDSIDDFWVQGYGTADTLFMKERVTGSMFGLGYNSYNRLPFSRQQAIYDAGNNDANNPDVSVSYPTLLTLGNFTDIKYVAPHAMWAFNGTYWLGFHHLNRDGRIMSAGGPYDAVKGVGINYRDTPLRSIRLPWEGDINQQATPTQVRGIDNASMITSLGQQNGNAVVLTQDNEIKIWGNHNGTYNVTPYAQTEIYSPMRPNNFA